MSLQLYIINSKISIKRSEYVFLITSKQASKQILEQVIPKRVFCYFTRVYI